MDLLSDLLNQNLNERVQLRRGAQYPVLQSRSAGACARRATSSTCRRCSSRPCQGGRTRVERRSSTRTAAGSRKTSMTSTPIWSRTSTKHHYGRRRAMRRARITRQKLQEALKRRGLDTHIFESAGRTPSISCQRQGGRIVFHACPIAFVRQVWPNGGGMPAMRRVLGDLLDLKLVAI